MRSNLPVETALCKIILKLLHERTLRINCLRVNKQEIGCRV